MIRVYFVFDDPLDEEGINLSYFDVPTQDPRKAFARIEEAADSGELWERMYPGDKEHPYSLINSKMTYLDISTLTHEQSVDTLLTL